MVDKPQSVTPQPPGGAARQQNANRSHLSTGDQRTLERPRGGPGHEVARLSVSDPKQRPPCKDDAKPQSDSTGRPSSRWPEWYSKLAGFQTPSTLKSTWQLTNTLGAYLLLLFVMIRLMQGDHPYWLVLILAFPASGLMVRTFILFHDCVHGSLFASREANAFWGTVLGVLTFTSFGDWRYSHLRHHATYSDLDKRGIGDVWTMTLAEYQNASLPRRLQYRLYRNPLVLIGLGAISLFLIGNRFPTRGSGRKELASVLLTDLLLVIIAVSAGYIIGWRIYLMVQLPVLWLASIWGIWLFYLQHQFENGYWARTEDWDPLRAAMEGSSFYRLPAVLRWFSGSIGYHHIHHLKPKIPNYQLKKCFDEIPQLQRAKRLNIPRSFSCARLKLWDEKQQKMVPFP